MEEKKTTLWQEIKICRVDETNYPHDLKKIKDRPEVLYYRGNIDILNEHKSIAVVGSRKISAVGAKLAYNAGSIIGKNGFNLVNGLALGCFCINSFVLVDKYRVPIYNRRNKPKPWQVPQIWAWNHIYHGAGARNGGTGRNSD